VARGYSAPGEAMTRTIYFGVGLCLGALVSPQATDERPDDPVKISPKYYTIRLENDRVRVLEYRLKPGEKEPMHSHPQGIVYYLANATMRVTLPGGTSTESKVTNGQVAWREFTRHAIENTGRTRPARLQ
jgi:beta-alanine degradation protein BauB